MKIKSILRVVLCTTVAYSITYMSMIETSNFGAKDKDSNVVQNTMVGSEFVSLNETSSTEEIVSRLKEYENFIHYTTILTTSTTTTTATTTSTTTQSETITTKEITKVVAKSEPHPHTAEEIETVPNDVSIVDEIPKEDTPTESEISTGLDYGGSYVWSTSGDITFYYYTNKPYGTQLKGGSGRTLIPGYSVACSKKYHKELYGKIIMIDCPEFPELSGRHFRIDDCGASSNKGFIDFYGGTGGEHAEYIPAERLRQGRFKNDITITIIGEWDSQNQCEILY
jgi:hypothetical protein